MPPKKTKTKSKSRAKSKGKGKGKGKSKAKSRSKSKSGSSRYKKGWTTHRFANTVSVTRAGKTRVIERTVDKTMIRGKRATDESLRSHPMSTKGYKLYSDVCKRSKGKPSVKKLKSGYTLYTCANRYRG